MVSTLIGGKAALSVTSAGTSRSLANRRYGRLNSPDVIYTPTSGSNIWSWRQRWSCSCTPQYVQDKSRPTTTVVFNGHRITPRVVPTAKPALNDAQRVGCLSTLPVWNKLSRLTSNVYVELDNLFTGVYPGMCRAGIKLTFSW